jgi:hypothetical protein
MPWYKAGTVSVTQNSNAVIGAGTAFIANSRVGDGFRGPDGAWYEVTNIASDTAMSISPNYQGATNCAGGYALAPLQGYVKDSADTLRALVNQYGAKLAALGTTGNYDVLPPTKGGTGIADLSAFIQTLLNDADAAAGRLTMGAAKSGANADINALSGLTTALSVAQGGTGNTTGTATKLAGGGILGTVSQSAGVPNGTIFESGSNSLGTYVKFADGTMITITYNTGPWSVLANSLTVLGPFGNPGTFVNSVYSVAVTAAPSATNDTYGVVTAYPASTSSAIFVFRNGATAQNLSNIKITCIGRWY